MIFTDFLCLAFNFGNNATPSFNFGGSTATAPAAATGTQPFVFGGAPQATSTVPAPAAPSFVPLNTG